jgi:multiple sugar transport system permease protein
MTATTTDTVRATSRPAGRRKAKGWTRTQSVIRGVVLGVGAVAFLFPFYYMVIGSLQKKPNQTLSGLIPDPSNLTLGNFTAVNDRISLLSGLLNSGLFTGGVLLCTLVFGVLVGYALAVLEWRGRGVTFAIVLLVQVIPFQLLQIPLYVLVARNYGLADNVLGMILPFAINSTAVILFRQYFLQVPKELFEAARIDGARELRLLWSVAIPLVRPALVTGILLTFIGPWNEFLWPFLITKQADRQPLAVSLANYITSVSSSAANPFGAVTAGALVLAVPVVVLFIVFQRYFVSSDLGSGVKG